MLKRWLWYFIKNYESKEEVELGKQLMDVYLNDDKQGTHIGQIKDDDRKLISVFITKSFNSNQRVSFIERTRRNKNPTVTL